MVRLPGRVLVSSGLLFSRLLSLESVRVDLISNLSRQSEKGQRPPVVSEHIPSNFQLFRGVDMFSRNRPECMSKLIILLGEADPIIWIEVDWMFPKIWQL